MKHLLLLLLAAGSGARSCKELSSDCEQRFLDESKATVDQVIGDFSKKEISKNHVFFSKYEANLHAYAVEEESKLMVDKFLLERLLKLQEQRNAGESCNENLTTEDTQKEACRALAANAKPCAKCVPPLYDSINMIHTCTQKYAFDTTNETRQVRCDFTKDHAELVYEGKGMTGKYSGELVCQKLGEKRLKRNPCPYTCAEATQCNKNGENELVCACLKGFRDLSALHKKKPGSICSQCNNTKSPTDYVMLLDVSGSVSAKSAEKMIEFLGEFLKFIDIDHSSNRVSLIAFDAYGKVILHIESKNTTQQILDFMKMERGIAKFHSEQSGEYQTNTPHALKVANNEVYALDNSKNRRVTILLTDGGPNNCISEYTSSFDSPREECIIDDLRTESRIMRDTHKAKIITIYAGRQLEEKYVKRMHQITSEDDELSVEDYKGLMDTMLDQVQVRMC